MKTYKITAEFLERLHNAMGNISQRELVTRTGIPQPRLSKLIGARGAGARMRIKSLEAEKLTEALGVSKAWLLAEDSQDFHRGLVRLGEFWARRGLSTPAGLLEFVWNYPVRQGAISPALREAISSWAAKESAILRGALGTAAEKPSLGVAIVTTELAMLAFGPAAEDRIAACTEWGRKRIQTDPPHQILDTVVNDPDSVPEKKTPDFRHSLAYGVILTRSGRLGDYVRGYVELALTKQKQHPSRGWYGESVITQSPVFTAIYAVELLHLVHEHRLMTDEKVSDELPSAIINGLQWLMQLRESDGLWPSGVLPNVAWDKLWASAWVLHRLGLLVGLHSEWRTCVEESFSQMINGLQSEATWWGTDSGRRYRVEARAAAAVRRMLLIHQLPQSCIVKSLTYLDAWSERAQRWANELLEDEMDVATAAFLVWSLVLDERELKELGTTVLEIEQPTKGKRHRTLPSGS
jgi:hypothetical protein